MKHDEGSDSSMMKQGSNSKNLYQALGLFLLTNAVIMLHGAVRVVFFSVQAGNAYGSETFRGFEQFPPGLQVAAAVGEIAFALYGFFVALAGIMGDVKLVKRHIKPCFIVSIILGWFAFGVYALGAELYTISKNEADVPAVAGIIAILGYCAAMIGSQAFFAFKILKIVGGEGQVHTSSFFRKRAIYYNILLLLVGVACLTVGSYAIDETGRSGLVITDDQIVLAYGGPADNFTMEWIGGGNPEGPSAETGGTAEGAGAEGGSAEGGGAEGAGAEGGGAEGGGAEGGNPEGSAVSYGVFTHLVQTPPFFVVVPALNVIIGLAMMALSLWGIARTMGDASAADGIDLFGYLSALVFVFHVGYLGLAAPAYVKSIAAGVQIIALAMCLHFMPVYLDIKMRGMRQVDQPTALEQV